MKFCWGITPDSLYMKLKRLKDSDVLNDLIKEEKAEYYKPERKLRGEWLFTVEAMEVLYTKK